MEKPIFSIVVPVYNAENTIEKCLVSLVNQTYVNIEIICVNDASMDRSLEIINQYAQKDDRVVLISENMNMGTSKARKDGVLKSTGKYILFVDSDDTLAIGACEKLYITACEQKKDIIQFGVNVIEHDGLSKARIDSMQNFFTPFEGDFEIEKVKKACFQESRLAHNLWGKLFDGDICRKAFEYIDDARLIMAEDLYAFFVIVVFSNTYWGMEDKLYNYNYGLGITSERKEYFEMLEIYHSQALAADFCESFISKIGKADEYQTILRAIRHKLIKICIDFQIKAKKKLSNDDVMTVQNIILRYWSRKDLAYISAHLLWRSQGLKRTMDEKKWLFPFESVMRNSKIILYGAGEVGKDYYFQIQKTGYCKIVEWVDKGYKNYSRTGLNICSPGCIANIEYDYIVIAIRDDKIKKQIKQSLLKQNIDKIKIV